MNNTEDKDVNELSVKIKSLSCRVSPSLEDTLLEIGFSLDLDMNSNLWIEQLKHNWRVWKKNPALESHIDNLFKSRPDDAFIIAIIYVTRCEEFKDCKPKSLPYFIMETLSKYSETNQVYADESIKLPAFHIAISQRSQQFMTLVMKIYQIASIKETIVPIVNNMIKNDCCKHAAQIVTALELFDYVAVESLLFPLILQDKSNLIDEYLNASPNQVKPLVLFLDKLLDKNFNAKEFVYNYAEENNICHINYDKLHHKPLGKLVARLCNKFSIPIETCKNLSKNRTSGGLRYLVYQKYMERNLNQTVWDELVKDSLKQNASAGPEFIDMLVDYDKNEALKWARHLNIPENQLPLAIQGTKEVKKEYLPTPPKLDNYYKSPLTKEQIAIIDSGEKFLQLINSDLVNQTVVSLDCEWKPSFGATQSQVAIIQIGTPDMVYLLDTIVLNKQEYTSLWHMFYKSFLDNAEIIKLGFGLEQDLREMKLSIVGLSSIKVKGEGLLDLSILWKSLLNHKLCLPSNSDSGSSLSCVVQSCFGKPLEKSEQCSNWELRPLRDTQIAYAALDAHVLLQIYYFLEKRSQLQQINFEDICNEVMVEPKKKATKKPRVAEKLVQSFSGLSNPKPASSVKFLVEPLLSDLTLYLRYCGIDTIEQTATTMLWHDVINVAISEDRFILLRRPKHTPTQSFPQRSILCVGNIPIVEQLHTIFNTFNLSIQQSDIMSICLSCNQRDMKKLNPEEVHKLCDKYDTACSKVDNTCYSEEDLEDYYSNFLSDSDNDEDMPGIPQSTSAEPVYQNKLCKTSKGALITIPNTHHLRSVQKPALLCEYCGKLFSEEDDLIRSVKETVSKVIIFGLTLN